jgi:TRAP-type C4-dicarboxylate transport system substrate-binding protein
LSCNEIVPHRAAGPGTRFRRAALAALLALVCAAGAPALTIKLGTVAPANSPWDLVLRRLAADWSRISDGEVELKIFPGGIAGDEPDMIRKMRIGQLHAATLTAGSLNDIYPGALALATPMLIRTNDEMIAVLGEVAPFLEQHLEQRGFVALMWAPIGWVKFFARQPVRTLADLRRQTLWVGDAGAAEIRAWQQAGFNVVALPVTEVTTALQSGMIDAYLTSPLAAASFQWFGIAPHMNDLSLAPLYGALLINKRVWERVPESIRPRLRAVARAAAERLSATAHEQDDLAVHVMRAHGLQVHEATAALEQDWEQIAAREFQSLIGEVIDPEAYRLVTATVAAYRARAATSD